nr:acyl-coenzyme A synthetase ACSM6, mitochondrial-like isoform X2 [Equus asinus]
MKGARVTLIRAPAGRRERRKSEQRLGAWNRLVPPKQICVGMKSQDPMAICFTNRTKGAPTLVEYSQHGLTMRFSQASRQNFKVLSDVSVMAE